MVSLVTTQVSLEEVCLPNFEVFNCWLNLVDNCLADENEIPLKVMASFSASRFDLPSIPLIVLHSLVRSVFWSMISTKSFHFFSACAHRYGSRYLYSILVSPFFSVCAHRYCSRYLYSILAVHVRWDLFYGGHLVCSSHPESPLVEVPHGVCGVQMWCDAALSRIVQNIFSSLWQSVGRERLLRAASTSCLYLS